MPRRSLLAATIFRVGVLYSARDKRRVSNQSDVEKRDGSG